MHLAVRSRSSPWRKAARLHVTRSGRPPQLQGRRGQAAPSATVAAPAATAGRDSRFLGDSPVNACAARSGTPTETTRGAGGSDADIWLTVIGGSVLSFMLPPQGAGCMASDAVARNRSRCRTVPGPLRRVRLTGC